MCLLAFSGLPLNKAPPTLKAPPKKKQKDWLDFVKPDQRISNAVSIYVNRVRNENHGIKEQNILSLLLPVSFNTDDLDELLIAEVNDFASKRGNAAHASASKYVSIGVNPLDEGAQVKRIVDGFKLIDEKLTQILGRTR